MLWQAVLYGHRRRYTVLRAEEEQLLPRGRRLSQQESDLLPARHVRPRRLRARQRDLLPGRHDLLLVGFADLLPAVSGIS